jgi:hypothetical protein
VPLLAEEALLAFTAAAGLLLAWARPLPRFAGAVVAAPTAAALALDSPPEGLSIAAANLALLGTAIGAVAMLGAIASAAAGLRRNWQRIGARVLGSWIAASAILVLALRLVG